MKKNYCISIISLLKLMRKFLKILEREKEGFFGVEEEEIRANLDGCGCEGKVGCNFRFFKYVVNDQALAEIVYP